MVVRAGGCLDWASCPVLREALTPELAAPRLILDLAGVTSWDGAGTGLVLATIARRGKQGLRTALVATDVVMLDLFHTFGADTVATVTSSAAKARRRLAGLAG